jgi:hypothetical protein
VITNTVTHQSITIVSRVTLFSPRVPSITGISTDALAQGGYYQVLRSKFVHFSGTATDPNNQLLAYRWDFTVPPETLWGRAVMLRPDAYPGIFDQGALAANGPVAMTGNLTVIDRFALQDSQTVQSFVNVQVWADPAPPTP